MPIVDRLEYPKKYRLKGSLLLLVILVAIGGIVYLRLANAARAKRIVIHSVAFDEYDTNFIRVNYEIENKGKKTEEADLLVKVFDAAGIEIASIFFRTRIEAQTREFQGKYIDKLYRPLKDGEQPNRVTIELRQRGLLDY